MTDSNYLSTTEAGEISGVSSRTILNMIKRGKLSASRDDHGNFRIEKSEFYRVFPEKLNQNKNESQETNESALLKARIEHLEEILSEKKSQISFLHEQLKDVASEKKILLETLNSNQKLLEHQTEKTKTKKLFKWI